MKKLFTITILVILALSQDVEGGDTQYEWGKKSISTADFRKSSAFIARLDEKAETMKQAIRNTPAKIDIRGSCYYFAGNGRDSNDGLSPDQPLRSLDKLNDLALNPGDVVLFHRGCLWRGAIRAKPGVTYSAYGEGAKPRIYGSPCDAAKTGKWIETETPNVYVYDRELSKDIGTLVFNDGESCAMKVMKRKTDNGRTVHIETNEVFNDYRDLHRDLDFYHDYSGAKRVYLCSQQGAPSSRFSSIELLVRSNIIYAANDITVDNLCLKYCGAHGIGSGSVSGYTVTNCELGWIGGSIQYEKPDRPYPTRYGNAIEIYGSCQYFRVDHCYIYQVYDAGVTHQFGAGREQSIVMRNVVYSNNLIEDCVYSIEYFVGDADTDSIRCMNGISIHDNVMRRSGFGWGKQRPDKTTPAHIKSWSGHPNRATDFIIRNNIFDRGAVELLNIAARQKEWLPVLHDNTYVQFVNIPAGSLGDWTDSYNRYPFDEDTGYVLRVLFDETNARLFYVEPLDVVLPRD